VNHAWWSYPALAGVGLVAGALNVIAGGGSFLSLPAMIFLGLPPTVANGTNRVAILVQNGGAVWGFHRRSLVPWRWLMRAAVPGVAGAILGAWLAVRVGDESFKNILSVVMIAVSLLSLWRPGGGDDAVSEKAGREGEASATVGGGSGEPVGEAAAGAVPARAPELSSGPWSRIGLGAGFLLVGIYGGFVQAGTGFLFLAVLTWAGFDLVRGNALKVLVILLWTPLALWQFAASGEVDWLLGLALAAGNFTGALVGVHLTVLKGSRWVRRVVTVAVIAFAVLLWLVPG